jgi:hypothetical protein
MKKIITTIVLSVLFYSANACEICGCGLGNYYIGILPQFSHKFLGLRYQFNKFSTRLNSDPTQFSNDYYQTVELWSGWNLGKRWQILVFVPLNIIHQTSDEGTSKKSGLGDIALLGNYKVFDKRSKSGNNIIAQQFWVGAGVKIPAGKFHIDAFDPDVAAAANTQTGSGSTDVMFNAMYNIHVNKLGISANATYKLNTTNKSDYKFGSKFSANSFVYYSIASTEAKVTVTPDLGVLYEHAAGNQINNSKVNFTGGNLVLASAGAEINFNKVTVGFNAQLPVSQNFAEGQTKSKVKGMMHITFSL